MNRRNIAIGAALIPAALLAQTGEKPNIILITTDQQTAGAMSCAGNPYLRTPAMDALASDGILFTGAYSPFPLSGPCRASLLTGCYPSVDKGEMHNLLDDPEYAGQLKTCRLKMQKWADRLRNWQCKVRIDPIVKYTYETPNDPVTILSTDLSVDLDPDDWFDAYLFMKSAWMRPQGIILTDYAGEKELELARQLEQIAGHTEIPLLAGVNERFESGKTPRNTEGAEFILKTLREQRVKTRLIAVGSLRNEALAYEMDPELFKRKVEEVVFVSVPLNGEKATNVNRDTAAVRVIFDSGVPILAVPNVKQKLSGEMEATIAATNSAVCDFLTKRLADWRGRRRRESPGFLKKTEQLEGQGKNLWSLPVFIPETRWAEFGIKAVRCSASYAPGTSTAFPEDKRGNDFLMTEWNADALLEYTMKMICE